MTVQEHAPWLHVEEKLTQYQNKSIHNVSSAAKKVLLPRTTSFKKRTSVPVLALFLSCWFWRCGVCKERTKQKVIDVSKMQRQQHFLNALRVVCDGVSGKRWQGSSDYPKIGQRVTSSQRRGSYSGLDSYLPKLPKSGSRGDRFEALRPTPEIVAGQKRYSMWE